MLAKLATHRRVLVVAAHPDDEDTALLTLVARGMGGESAYLSLSRGDGGQNLIGEELGTGLGVIRTQELNAARKLDGARQYFTRAYDFGLLQERRGGIPVLAARGDRPGRRPRHPPLPAAGRLDRFRARRGTATASTRNPLSSRGTHSRRPATRRRFRSLPVKD